MTSFRHLKSTIRLHELAEEAPDLTQEGILTPKRIETMRAEASSLQLLYATERVSEVILQALFDLAIEMNVLTKMAKMQAGGVVNHIEAVASENRPALHTAMRDFFDNQNPAKVAKEASSLAYAELQKLKEFLVQIDAKEQFTDVVQIGIGGSELGPKAIYLALQAYKKEGRRVHFLSNVDPDESAHLFKELDLSKTLFLSVSKSGGTLETLTNEELVRAHLKRAGLDPKAHFAAITGKGSPMDNPERYLASFYIWDYIGGRYSVTSMVGCVCLAFALGMDRTLDFLRGASSMDKAALFPEMRHNLPLLLALLSLWNRNFLGYPTVGIIPYAHALSSFPAHLQQLAMESNGKSIDTFARSVDFDTSAIFWGEVGTNGQHSFFQLLHQGTEIVPLEIIGFRKSQYGEDHTYKGTTSQEKLIANYLAQILALALGQKSENPNKNFSGNRPSLLLHAEKLDPFTMGALLSLYEHRVAFEGFLWNINSFDQEGVELGKKLSTQILQLMQNKTEAPLPLAQSYLKLL